MVLVVATEVAPDANIIDTVEHHIVEEVRALDRALTTTRLPGLHGKRWNLRLPVRL